MIGGEVARYIVCVCNCHHGTPRCPSPTQSDSDSSEACTRDLGTSPPILDKMFSIRVDLVTRLHTVRACSLFLTIGDSEHRTRANMIVRIQRQPQHTYHSADPTQRRPRPRPRSYLGPNSRSPLSTELPPGRPSNRLQLNAPRTRHPTHNRSNFLNHYHPTLRV